MFLMGGKKQGQLLQVQSVCSDQTAERIKQVGGRQGGLRQHRNHSAPAPAPTLVAEPDKRQPITAQHGAPARVAASAASSCCCTRREPCWSQQKGYTCPLMSCSRGQKQGIPGNTDAVREGGKFKPRVHSPSSAAVGFCCAVPALLCPHTTLQTHLQASGAAVLGPLVHPPPTHPHTDIRHPILLHTAGAPAGPRRAHPWLPCTPPEPRTAAQTCPRPPAAAGRGRGRRQTDETGRGRG